ncbi:MAG: 2Fe-2S iron-sulfur cluster binding domain-containing protein [Gammaproteobacteria bacterium]|nr:2Fe-2S iron-sulfur cluster binding domain-containing protein [Gammaproteobacteria bacterium]
MSEHNVVLAFADDKQVTIKVTEAETLVEAATRQGITLEVGCEFGVCGACKAHCVEGAFELEDFDPSALTVFDQKRNYVLACVMHPKSDCQVDFSYDSDKALGGSNNKALQGTVSSIDMVSDTVARLAMTLPEGEVFQFDPGQYVNLTIPGAEHYRSYSFANPPYETDEIVFYVRLLPEGLMSNYLRQSAKVGDQIGIEGPHGHFYLREIRRPIMMIAGGTGLAPMLSMLDQMVDQGATEQPIRLYYGANNYEELFAMDKLEGYRRAFADFDFDIVLVNRHPEWSGATGFVTDLLPAGGLNGGDLDVYLCGPPPMIDASTQWLVKHGLDEDHDIHAEKFTASVA